MKQSFAWWCFAGHTEPEDLLRSAAVIGYQAVELLDEALFPLVKKCGLEISAHGAHKSLTHGLNQREHHATILREFEASLRLAERWAIPNLICFSGNRAGLSDTEGIAITAEGLRQMAPLAEAAGVTLVLELLNSKVDHPDYQCDHTDWGVAVVKEVNSSSVKLLYDIYHMQIMEGDLIRTIQTHHPHFGHYHTAGNPGRHELNDQQELSYPGIFRAIGTTGFSGYIAHEFVPTGNPQDALTEVYTLCATSMGRLKL